MVKQITNQWFGFHKKLKGLCTAWTMTCFIVMVGCLPLHAVEEYTIDSVTVKFLFRRSSTFFDIDYMDNSNQYKILKEFLQNMDSTAVVTDVNVEGSASPEGTYAGNKRLAEQRAASLRSILQVNHSNYFTGDINWTVTQKDEDWDEVLYRVKNSDIDNREVIANIIETVPEKTIKNGRTTYTRKNKLKYMNGGKTWKELDSKIFPYVRGAGMQLIIKIAHIPEPEPITELEPIVVPVPVIMDTLAVDTVVKEIIITDTIIQDTVIQDTIVPAEELQEIVTRQPMLAVKTNMLLYGFYLPQYGFAPIPNIAVEFYPCHGHWTAGLSLDMPWYRNYSKHKFFQARNWQFEARRYFRGDADYTGLYAQAYIHTGVFGIGFSKYKGWEGEGLGGGIGVGYVMPISKDKHWKLEFNLQCGYFTCKYDPYIYGHPTDGAEDGLYYYDWKLKPELFKERQYRFNWFGPTRVGVTISYDLLYYRSQRHAE